jgi:hypothetical protein
VAALKAKRKVKGEAFYKGKIEVAKAPYQKIIESYGHQYLSSMVDNKTFEK